MDSWPMILAAVVAASPSTMNLPPATKANMPVSIVMSQKKPAALALKRAEPSALALIDGIIGFSFLLTTRLDRGAGAALSRPQGRSWRRADQAKGRACRRSGRGLTATMNRE